MCVHIMLMNMKIKCLLLVFLCGFIILPSCAAADLDARLPGVLASKRRYHVVNRLADYLPLPPVDPLSPVLPEAYCSDPPGVSPPSTTSLPPPSSPYIGTYNPSPPVSPSYSYPTPPTSPSSSYPSYPTPPLPYGTPNTPPTSTNPGSPASYQPSPILSPPNYEPSPGVPTSTNPGSPASYQPSPILSPPNYEPSPGVSPPYTNEPSPGLSPPYNNEPSPGLSPPYNNEPSPPTFSFPSPTGFIPAPPLFEPPVVYPPPTGPPPAHTEPESALWCVAKPSVPDPIIQEAMNYACGSGADCESLQPNGDCFQPDTLFAHASYAFNSYWQRTKVAGGTCEFGGSAMLVTVDPSYDGCHFIYY